MLYKETPTNIPQELIRIAQNDYMIDTAFLSDGILLQDIAKEVTQLQAENKRLKEALEQIRDLETDCCPRCEGNGRVYADGKAHFMSENAPTIFCGNCGGSGRILPEDAQEIAEQALQEKENG